MSFSDILRPRKDVLSGDGVEGIIDLENLRDSSGKRLEARPKDFLDLTYPTSDIKFVLENLHQRFNEKKRSAGLYLFEGYKGSGKSHILLFIHHLARNRSLANEWLSRSGLRCHLPEDVEVIWHKFTDFPLYSLWNLIMKGDSGSSSDRPNLDQLRKAITGRHVFLVLDELEMGIRSIANKAIQDQNLAFLQMLTEESGRSESPQITIFAGIYDSAQEPGATLKRVPRIDVKFADPSDRARIVLHRLFENYDAVDRKKVEAVISSYRNDWKRKGLEVNEEYLSRLLNTYPFSPELLVLVQEQARNLFQGTRGALGLLGAVVKYAHRKVDIITTSHASIRERSILNRLIDLDPGMTIVKCAQSDFKDLGDRQYAEEIVSSVLLATLAAAGKIKGMTEVQIGLQVLRPGDDVNEFRGALRAFQKYGTYFHEQEGMFFFDPEEKPNAKVEYKSLSVDPSKALAKAFEFWTGDLFNDRDAVVFQNIEQTQAELRLRDSRRMRFVLAPRRLSPDDRHAVYYGQSNRNMIILFEPRNKDFDALKNPDILKWAQRHIAASDLQTAAGTAERRRQFEKIAREDKDYIVDAFRKAGFAYIKIERFGEQPIDDAVEIELLGSASSRPEVDLKLSQQFYPIQLFEEHLLENIANYTGKRLRDIERVYRETLGYPVPTHVTKIREAMANLCVRKEIGLRHAKDSACGRKPLLAENEWPDVVVSEPFEDQKGEPSFPGGGDQYPPISRGGEESGQPNCILEDEKEETEKQQERLIVIETTFIKGTGALRQEAAVILADHQDAEILEVTFRIYLEKKNVDLGSMPGGLRGSLSGMGNITADLTIVRAGEFKKSDVEQMVEALPVFSDGLYKAEMKLVHMGNGD